MQTIQSWSGGKDSTASIILEHIHGLPPSTIIMSEVMFDKTRGISGELPEHIEWVHNVAVPLFKSWGYEVNILRADKDYLDMFHLVRKRSRMQERNGKQAGFVQGGRCEINKPLKIKPIKDFFKTVSGNYIQYVGIAADETERLKRLKGTNKISLLEKYGYTERMAYDLCKSYGLLSPIYAFSNRGGCWFCPNNSIAWFAHIKQTYPELWAELKKLSHTSNLVSQNFKYTATFAEIDAKVDKYIARQQGKGE